MWARWDARFLAFTFTPGILLEVIFDVSRQVELSADWILVVIDLLWGLNGYELEKEMAQ